MATTSANRSGLPSAQTAQQAVESIGDRVDLIVDGGQSPGGFESTVLDLSVSPPKILREGPVKAAQIESVLGLRLAQS